VSLQRTPFHRVLHRPSLFLGGEREPALLTAIIAGALAVTGQNVPSVAGAAVLWFGCIALFRWMAKADPQMTRVYFRHIRYRDYYPPRSRPFRKG
jgi:type IV secretion system protein VirB3